MIRDSKLCADKNGFPMHSGQNDKNAKLTLIEQKAGRLFNDPSPQNLELNINIYIAFWVHFMPFF